MSTQTMMDAEAFRSVRKPIPSRAESRAYGKSLRVKVPRATLGYWSPADNRPDPIEQIMEAHLGRIPRLIAVRVARMAASPLPARPFRFSSRCHWPSFRIDFCFL